ncbi:ABC transporter permease [Bifidobacterium saguinibicoloris]|uniref:ABC transporter permease n=1 Tax=Bifidobacterium saguinibicoloris TaxID=2834433 RepID=UPI001C5A32C1|nr:ABC transporter permease [Bifidobacterium saguinibicoloris]MBW3081350.1 ABC transporter permease [Bifidobacterium saguinibicoloris]
MHVKKLNSMEITLLVIIAVYAAVVSLVNPNFLTLGTLADLTRNGTGMAILAAGVTMIMISGGIDVSFPAVAIMSGYTSVVIAVNAGIDSILVILLLAAVIGALLGAINALLIHWLALPTFIVTLGTSSVFYGLMATVVGTKPVTISQMPKSLLAFGRWNIISFTSNGQQSGIAGFFLIAVLVYVVIWFIMNHTTLGHSIYAIGNSEESARRAGLSPLKIKLFIYPLMGVLAALMAIISFANLKFVDPTSIMGTELTVIAAVVIGGTRITGGYGTLFGTFLGVALVQLLNNTLVFLGIQSSWNSLFIGAVMVCAVVAIYYGEKRRNRRNMSFLV